MEEWKQIEGFESYYISNKGVVKSTLFHKERMLKPFRVGNYLGVWLGKGNKRYIHHLVAETFLTRIEGFEIDHINRDKHDNRAENLRWVSASDNHKNANVKEHYKISKYGKIYLCKAHIV